jgi:hypothetical protein
MLGAPRGFASSSRDRRQIVICAIARNVCAIVALLIGAALAVGMMLNAFDTPYGALESDEVQVTSNPSLTHIGDLLAHVWPRSTSRSTSERGKISHHRVCALVVSTTLPPHTPYLRAMRDTLQADKRVRLLYLFNGDSEMYVNHTRGPTPPEKDAEHFCAKHGLDECVVIREGCVQTKEWSAACVSRSMLSTRVAQMNLHESCDFIIKLDPDSFIIPSSTMAFLKDVDPTKPAYFGTWSSSRMNLGEGLGATVMMGQGNFLASAYTWSRMTMDGMEGCFPKLKNGLHHHGGRLVGPITPFESTADYSIGGTADEVITSFCAWHTFGSSRVTNWRPFVFSIGGANASRRTTRLVLDAPKTTQQCVMLIHKFNVSEWRGAYQYLEDLNHTHRSCVGNNMGEEGQFLLEAGSYLTKKGGKNLPILASFSAAGVSGEFWGHKERSTNANRSFPSDWDVDRPNHASARDALPVRIDIDFDYPPNEGQRFRNLSSAVAEAKRISESVQETMQNRAL